MEQLIDIVLSIMLVTMCVSGILTIAVFWYLVLSRLFDGITGVIPTDKQVEDLFTAFRKYLRRCEKQLTLLKLIYTVKLRFKLFTHLGKLLYLFTCFSKLKGHTSVMLFKKIQAAFKFKA